MKMKRETLLSELFMYLQVFSKMSSLLPAQGIKAWIPERNSNCQGCFSLVREILVCRPKALPAALQSPVNRETCCQHYKTCTHTERKLSCKGTKPELFPFQLPRCPTRRAYTPAFLKMHQVTTTRSHNICTRSPFLSHLEGHRLGYFAKAEKFLLVSSNLEVSPIPTSRMLS